MRPVRVRRMLTLAVVCVTAIWAFVLGFTSGGSRIVVRALSPDGRWAASVRDQLELDGPNHVLAIESPGTRTRIDVAGLAPDMQWCTEATWAPDSSHVAFLINNQHIAVYAAEPASKVAEVDLVSRDASTLVARRLRFSTDGHYIEYDACDTQQGRCEARQAPLFPSAASGHSGTAVDLPAFGGVR